MNAGWMLLTAACLLACAHVAGAQEGTRVDDLPGTTVIGDQELPKVLYIVPWKEAEGPGALAPPRPVPGEAAFFPVDRAEFLRLLRYQKFMSGPRAPE